MSAFHLCKSLWISNFYSRVFIFLLPLVVVVFLLVTAVVLLTLALWHSETRLWPFVYQDQRQSLPRQAPFIFTLSNSTFNAFLQTGVCACGRVHPEPAAFLLRLETRCQSFRWIPNWPRCWWPLQSSGACHPRD